MSRSLWLSLLALGVFTLAACDSGGDDDDEVGDDDTSGDDDDDATDPLPAWLKEVETTVSIPCDGCATEHVLFTFGCGAREDLIAVDTEGQVAWYQEVGAPMAGFTVTPAGSVLAIVEREEIVEWNLAGEELMRLTKGSTPGFDRFVHHDVMRSSDGSTLAVTSRDWEDGNGYTWIMDGAMRFADGVAVESWDLLDIGIQPGPNHTEDTGYWNGRLVGQDWTHGNGIDVDPSGAVLLSLTGIHTIVNVTQGPSLAWRLDGSGLESDLAVTASAGGSPNFFGFHHVRSIPSGLALYDNRNPHNGCSTAGTCQDARYLEVALDQGGGQADITTATGFGLDCPSQGSATRVGNAGNVLLSCSEDQVLREVNSSGTPVWELAISCAVGEDRGPIYRALPIDL